MTNNEFRLRMKYLMQRMGWNRNQMAEQLGCTSGNLYYWLQGISNPRPATVNKLQVLYDKHNVKYIEDTTTKTQPLVANSWVLVKTQNVDLSLKPSMPGVFELYVSEPSVKENDLVYVSDSRGLRVMQVVEIASDALGVIRMITSVENLTIADIRNIDVCRINLK